MPIKRLGRQAKKPFIVLIKRLSEKVSIRLLRSRAGAPDISRVLPVLTPFSSKYDRFGKRNRSQELKRQAVLRKAATHPALAIRHADAD